MMRAFIAKRTLLQKIKKFQESSGKCFSPEPKEDVIEPEGDDELTEPIGGAIEPEDDLVEEELPGPPEEVVEPEEQSDENEAEENN